MAKKRIMTPEHKAAIAAGRAEGATVKRYLAQLQVKGKPGRPIDPERAGKKLAEVTARLQSEGNPLTRLELEQDMLNLQQKLDVTTDSTNMEELEQEFVKVAKNYAARKAISYQAFRNVGVPAAVLKRARISRTGA